MNCNVRTFAVFTSSILVCFAVHCFAAEPAGYAWPKTDILITNSSPLTFKSLKTHGTYPLLVTLQSGYSVVCESVDGQKRAAFLPLRDRFGNPLDIQRVGDGISVSSGFVIYGTLDLNDVVLKPGIIPLQGGVKYPVLSKSEDNLSIQFVSAHLTQTVVVAGSDTRFLTLMEYNKAAEVVIQDLKAEADKAIANGDLGKVRDIFKLYKGEFADDTVDGRERAANEYAGRVSAALEAKEEQRRLEQEKFAAEQKAKGLVEFHGEWITPTERDARVTKEAEEAKQRAEHDQWVEDHKSEIIRDVVANNHKAADEANAAYPDDPDKNWAYMEQFFRRSDAALCTKYGISQTKLEAILTGWGLENKRAFDQKWQQFQEDIKQNGQ